MLHSRRFQLALGAIFIALLITGSQAAAEGAKVKVLRSIPFAENSGASGNVQSQCELQTKVPSFLGQYASNVELVDELGSSGRVLELTISNVQASGGGAFSGAKFLTVTGVLRENGKRIGNFTATRYSGGGAFGGFKGTCAIIGRCAKTIGRDIANWLKSPSKDARLGNA